jgi:S-adenosylmethionine decarboxylase proenzyme
MRGLHLTADLFGCRDPAGLMRDGAALAALCEQLAADAGLSVVARQFHAFDPRTPATGAGHTGVLLLAESHLAVHTWPELHAVTLDVFVCNYSGDNTHKAQQLIDALVPRFDASHVNRQQLARGRAP